MRLGIYDLSMEIIGIMGSVVGDCRSSRLFSWCMCLKN